MCIQLYLITHLYILVVVAIYAKYKKEKENKNKALGDAFLFQLQAIEQQKILHYILQFW